MIDIAQGIKTNPTKCPTCGRKAVEYLIEDIEFHLENGQVKHFKQVPYWKCQNCGERMFDGESDRFMETQPDYPKKKKSIQRKIPN